MLFLFGAFILALGPIFLVMAVLALVLAAFVPVAVFVGLMELAQRVNRLIYG